MGMMVSQITSLTIVYSTVYSGEDQREHQSSTSLAFVRGIYRWPVNSPHKSPVTRKIFPFDDVIMVKDYVIFWAHVKYTPIIMHMGWALFCFAMVWYQLILPISFKVTSGTEVITVSAK